MAHLSRASPQQWRGAELTHDGAQSAAASSFSDELKLGVVGGLKPLPGQEKATTYLEQIKRIYST